MAYSLSSTGRASGIFGTQAEPGLVTACIDQLLKLKPAGCELVASFAQVCNEQVFDLSSSAKDPLRLVGKGEIQGISKHTIDR
jgi:hypothetical protein